MQLNKKAKFITKFFQILPLLTLFLFAGLQGVHNLLSSIGYAGGFILTIIYFTFLIMHNQKVKVIFFLTLVNYVLLDFILISHIITKFKLAIQPVFIQGNHPFIESVIFMLLLYVQAILIATIMMYFFWKHIFMDLSPNEIEKTEKIMLPYLVVQGLGIMVYPGLLVLDSLSTLANTKHLPYKIPIAYLTNVLAIISWAVICVVQYLYGNDKTIGKIVEKRDFEKFPLKNKIFVGFAIFLIVSTFFEIFRGLWLVWFGTALWITLIFASLWRIFRNIFASTPSPPKSFPCSAAGGNRGAYINL